MHVTISAILVPTGFTQKDSCDIKNGNYIEICIIMQPLHFQV